MKKNSGIPTLFRVGWFNFHKNHKKYFNDELAKYNLSLIQAFCLLMVNASVEVNQKDLADGLYLSKGAITKAINKLESEELIIREKSSRDRRQFILKVSDDGKDLIPHLMDINMRWEEKMGIKELSPEFIRVFHDLTSRSIDLNFEKEE